MSALNRRVLVIDDEPDIRETLALLLSEEGYAVETASNGRDALDRIERDGAPGLVVVDLMMPVMDGWRFVEEARRSPALNGTPVMAVSAVSRDRSRASAFEAYVEKPFDLENFLATVARLCSRRPGLEPAG